MMTTKVIDDNDDYNDNRDIYDYDHYDNDDDNIFSCKRFVLLLNTIKVTYIWLAYSNYQE